MTQPFAEYNLHDDKLKFYPGYRLPEEEFEAFRKQGMSWWRGSKCLAGVWSPMREDMVLQYVDEIAHIVDDDCGLVYRMERFTKYSDNAEARANSHQERLDYLIEHGPPMGQPILVGHHSEKHARKLQKEMDSAQRKAIEEQDRAGYWAWRTERAEKHAAFKERPDVIYRRIERYETDLRGHQRTLAAAQDVDQWELRRGKSEEAEQRRQRAIVHAQRWIAHLEAVIAYQRELYEKSGGIPADKNEVQLEEGGAVICWCSHRDFIPIMKVNGKTVTVPDTHNDTVAKDAEGNPYYTSVFTRTIPKHQLTKVLSKAEYEKHGSYAYGQALLRGYTERHKPKIKEGGPQIVRGGGVQYWSWGYSRDKLRWAEVIRVNPKTVTILVKRQPADEGREDKIEKEQIVAALAVAEWQAQQEELINAYYEKHLKSRY
ncbi:MAG: DUF3560 domain-containing protein [Anaerolineae bacterium]|nr:DUF3560 domain-containing protein [Anaerolineae bacterium]